MTTEQLTANILRHWHAATADDLAAGLDWYRRAQDLATTLAAGAPISTAQAAGCVAALSPRCGWSVNAAGAATMVDAVQAGAPDEPMVGGLPLSRSRAWQILHHAGDPLDILRGPKVRSFYRNIMGDTNAVTVDIWAARAAEADEWRERAPEGARYERLADAYRRAAELANVTPREMQAAVWVQIRRTEARAIFDVRPTTDAAAPAPADTDHKETA